MATKKGTATQADESAVVIEDEPFEAFDPAAPAGEHASAEAAAVADTESDQAEPAVETEVVEPETPAVATPVATPVATDSDSSHRSAMAERVRGLRQVQASRAQGVGRSPVFAFSPEDQAKLRQTISVAAQAAAEKLDPGGISGSVAAAIAETVTEGVTKELADRFGQYQHESHQYIDAREMRRVESLFKRSHPDYEKVLVDSGLLDAVALKADGTPMHPDKHDPEMLRAVYGDVNPAATAYDLAIGILEDRKQRGMPVDVRPAEASTGKPVQETASTPPVPAKAADIVAAEKRGAESVTNALETVRPRGVGSMPSAGAPSAPKKWDKSTLSRLIDSGPDGYARAQKMFEANPGMEEWYYG